MSNHINKLFIVSIINSIETNYVDPDKPDEMIVYTQTSKFVHELSSEIINEIENNDINVLIDTSDGYTWPWAWYMRNHKICLLYTSPSPRDRQKSRMPSSA